MANFKSILEDIGSTLKKVFGVAEKVAVIAEPIVDLAFPGIAGLYNATVNEVGVAETAAIAAGKQSGSGAQKLAAVVAAITPTFISYAKANGLPEPTTDVITNYTNAVVASLKAIPAAA